MEFLSDLITDKYHDSKQFHKETGPEAIQWQLPRDERQAMQRQAIEAMSKTADRFHNTS
jgi:hypothetical protein